MIPDTMRTPPPPLLTAFPFAVVLLCRGVRAPGVSDRDPSDFRGVALVEEAPVESCQERTPCRHGELV